MELKIDEFAVAEKVGFNFEELKGEVAAAMTNYAGLVYTDKELLEAKKDLAKLRKFKTALDDARKNVKNELLKPYKEFEAKLNEIKELVDEPIGLIDTQVKNYEEEKKNAKIAEIKNYFESECESPFDGFLDAIFNPKWLNATYSMASIKSEITEAITKYNNGLVSIRKLTEFQFEAEMEYRRTLDLAKALEKQFELKELAEERHKANVEWRENLKKEIKADEAKKAEEAKTATWVGFEALLTPRQAERLVSFFNEYEIKYRKPQKGETE